jgi:hypothetical protein
MKCELGVQADGISLVHFDFMDSIKYAIYIISVCPMGEIASYVA